MAAKHRDCLLVGEGRAGEAPVSTGMHPPPKLSMCSAYPRGESSMARAAPCHRTAPSYVLLFPSPGLITPARTREVSREGLVPRESNSKRTVVDLQEPPVQSQHESRFKSCCPCCTPLNVEPSWRYEEVFFSHHDGSTFPVSTPCPGMQSLRNLWSTRDHPRHPRAAEPCWC